MSSMARPKKKNSKTPTDRTKSNTAAKSPESGGSDNRHTRHLSGSREFWTHSVHWIGITMSVVIVFMGFQGHIGAQTLDKVLQLIPLLFAYQAGLVKAGVSS